MLTANIVRSLITYDPGTGTFTWKERSPSMFPKLPALAEKWNARHAGKTTGRKSSHGICITIYDRRYRAHRVAWLIMTGSWPERLIDHINGIPDDNRWCNLREATYSQNAMNAARRTASSTGFKGVSFNKSKRMFSARITSDGKTFWLGWHKTPELAHDAYVAASRKYFGSFARAA